LTNALATFQTLMNKIFRNLLDIFVIIYSRNAEDHEEYLRQVLRGRREHPLYARPSKCTFFADPVGYLRHIADGDELRPNPRLVQAITDFPRSKTPKELLSLLRLAIYYRKHMPGFSNIALPLTDATRKDTQCDVRTYILHKANHPLMALPSTGSRSCDLGKVGSSRRN